VVLVAHAGDNNGAAGSIQSFQQLHPLVVAMEEGSDTDGGSGGSVAGVVRECRAVVWKYPVLRLLKEQWWSKRQ
jgi:hypothetical protein